VSLLSRTSRKAISFLHLHPRAFLDLLIESVKSWSAHNVPKMGAALSYYTAFSLGPLVVFII
jgi:uncharacterized BrkB/YihY/UPF0761 family membrane protein